MNENPRKELEDQLLAAEMNHETAQLNNDEFEKLYDEILEEFGPADIPGMTTSDPPIRNFANGYGKGAPSQPSHIPEPPAAQEPPVRRKGVKGLVILLCLELAAIAGLSVYWALNGYAEVLTVLFYQLMS